MKWIEFIRVRSSAAALKETLPKLTREVEAFNASDLEAEAVIMQHALYHGDLALVLAWHTDEPPAKSREGLMLASQLEKHGPIDHAVWIPAIGCIDCPPDSKFNQ